MHNRKSLSAKSIDSDSIYNHEGEKIGEIKDLMINISKGSVEYVVVSFGGFLGFGDKYFAVPWHLFKSDQANKKFLLDVDIDILEDIPGFDKDNWPDTLTPRLEKKWMDIARVSKEKASI